MLVLDVVGIFNKFMLGIITWDRLGPVWHDLNYYRLSKTIHTKHIELKLEQIYKISEILKI